MTWLPGAYAELRQMQWNRTMLHLQRDWTAWVSRLRIG